MCSSILLLGNLLRCLSKNSIVFYLNSLEYKQSCLTNPSCALVNSKSSIKKPKLHWKIKKEAQSINKFFVEKMMKLQIVMNYFFSQSWKWGKVTRCVPFDDKSRTFWVPLLIFDHSPQRLARLEFTSLLLGTKSQEAHP